VSEQTITSSSAMAERPRELPRSLIRFRLPSSVIRKIMHKIAFLITPYRGIKGNISALSESFNAKKIVAEFHRKNASLLVKQPISVSDPPFGGLGVTYAIHLSLVGKLVVDFLGYN